MSYSVSKKFANMKPSATREILKATSDANIIAFAGGSPAVEAFPCNEVKKLSAEILEENPRFGSRLRNKRGLRAAS